MESRRNRDVWNDEYILVLAVYGVKFTKPSTVALIAAKIGVTRVVILIHSFSYHKFHYNVSK